MTRKFKERGGTFDEYKDISKTLTESNVGLSEIRDQSYTNSHEPSIDFRGENTGQSSDISMSEVPDEYNEFYDDWMKKCQNFIGKSPPTQVPIPRETLEKLVMTAEESNKICKLWVNEFEENAKKTTEILNNSTDPAKYRECLSTWRKSYKKMSNDLLELPAGKYQKEIFENLTGIPDIYSESFEGTAKLWKESKEINLERARYLQNTDEMFEEMLGGLQE